MTRFINLTPHPVTVIPGNDPREGRTFVPDGRVPRVAMKTVDLPPVDGVPIAAVQYGAVEGMPDPEEGVGYVVGAMVADRLAGRDDIYVPDTGPSALRDNGQVVAVRRLIKR